MGAMYGPKIIDGLRAFAQVAVHRHDDDQPAGYWFADAVLIRQGYQPKVAASIIDRLVRHDFIEYGVTARTGWLTDWGKQALAGLPIRGRRFRDDPDLLDQAITNVSART